MHIKAEADQQPHRADHAHQRHQHRRNDQRNAPEEEEQQQEDRHAGQRRRGGHLHQHLHPKGVFGHGQPGDVHLVVIAPPFRQLAHHVGHVVAVRLLFDRNVDADRLAVFGHERAFVERIPHGVVAHHERLGIGLRHMLHEILKLE